MQTIAKHTTGADRPTGAEKRAPPVKPIWLMFVGFLVPMMGTNLLQSLSGTLNNVYLGRLIGDGAVAAVSSFFPVLFLLISFVIGLGSGATVLIGQAYGANELARVKAVAGTTLSLCAGLGVLIALFGGPFAIAMLGVLGTPPDVIAEAGRYARVVLFSLPLMFIYMTYTTIVRGVGDARTPFYALVMSTVVGLALTPVLILGLFGAPRLGITGGPWATIVSATITMIWMAAYMLMRRHPLAPDRMLLRHLKIDWRLLKLLLKIGVPSGVQVIQMSLSELAVLSFVNAFGSKATEAYGVVNMVVSYVQMPAMSVSMATSVFGSQAIGRGDQSRLGAIVRTGLGFQLVVTGAAIVLIYGFSRSLLGLVIRSDEVVEIAESLLKISLWSYMIFGMASVLGGTMRSSGTVIIPVCISIAAIWGVEVPVAWFLSHRIGLDGVWIAYPVSFVALLAMYAAFYQLVWKKKTHMRLV